MEVYVKCKYQPQDHGINAGRPVDMYMFLHAHLHKNAWRAWKVFTNPKQGVLWGGHRGYGWAVRGIYYIMHIPSALLKA